MCLLRFASIPLDTSSTRVILELEQAALSCPSNALRATHPHHGQSINSFLPKVLFLASRKQCGVLCIFRQTHKHSFHSDYATICRRFSLPCIRRESISSSGVGNLTLNLKATNSKILINLLFRARLA
jgi:hypothetical protein